LSKALQNLILYLEACDLQYFKTSTLISYESWQLGNFMFHIYYKGRLTCAFYELSVSHP